MENIVIAAYGRTPFSRSRPKEPEKDPFGELTGEELLAAIMPEVLGRGAISCGDADKFLVGCALGVGEQWTFGGRTSSLLAGLSARVPSHFIDMQCGSGMAGIHTAFAEIASGQADIVIAAGMEQMTRVPVGPSLFKQGFMKVNKALLTEHPEWDMATGLNMGLTAELLASRGGYGRKELDAFAVSSHQRAALAASDGFFSAEIIPLSGLDEAGKPLRVSADLSIRGGTDSASLANLKPVFKEDGVITAGNSSPLNAGAAAMVLMSETEAKRRGVTPMARIIATGCAGVPPEMMGDGPVPASLKALERAGLSATDIDLWEINEAFSVVVLNAADKLGLAMDRVNVNGGALALGHPLGATGVRLVGTLARALQTSGEKYGCATACVGGGQGIATIIESINQ